MSRGEKSRVEPSRAERSRVEAIVYLRAIHILIKVNELSRGESSGDELRGAESSRADRLSKFVSFQIVKH